MQVVSLSLSLSLSLTLWVCVCVCVCVCACVHLPKEWKLKAQVVNSGIKEGNDHWAVQWRPLLLMTTAQAQTGMQPDTHTHTHTWEKETGRGNEQVIHSTFHCTFP